MWISLYLNFFITPVFWFLKPMAGEQVMSDRDSEDEVDDDVADFEDRRVCDHCIIHIFVWHYLPDQFSVQGFLVVPL